MNVIRIGDRIEPVQRTPLKSKPYWTAEYLAQKVFNPLPDQLKITKFYIQSHPLAPQPAFYEDMPAATPQLGEYEVLLVDKLLHPQRPVLVIIGPMGCGKTTVKNYVALHLVKSRKHCDKCMTKKRMISQIDFNSLTALNDLDGRALSQKIYSILCDELSARIKLHNPISPEEEFGKFWLHELMKYRDQKPALLAFGKILNMLSGEELEKQNLQDADIQKRRQVLGIIKKEDELYLDYLIRLWEYIIQNHFCGQGGCAYILLDNLDIVNPIVQRKIVEVVRTHARQGGPTFLLLMRPETFDYLGLGTGIIDLETHRGPKPSQIVQASLNDFCEDPDALYEPKGGLTKEQFNILKTFILHANRAIKNDTHQLFGRFLENACGQSIRAAQLLAQNLFLASISEMEDENIGIHDLIRLCIRGGEAQLSWKSNSGLEHLFRVSSREIGGLLVKSRILQYLLYAEQEARKLQEIITVVSGFGYEENLIYEAINDLMKIQHQLVRSNGFDNYEEGSLKKHGGHNVKITEIGKGYSDHLISNLDYIQEVMLDTYVDGNHFPKSISYGYLIDKFMLIHLFLEEIHRVDVEETGRFVDQWTSAAYRESFGHTLISLEIIHGIHPAVTRILGSVGHDQYEYEQLIDKFNSLALKVEADNKQLLGGEWVETIVKP